MMSLRTRAVLFLLEHRHWLRGRLRRETVDASTSIPALRERVDRSGHRFGALPAGVEVTPVDVGAMRAEWIRPRSDRADRSAILYFHGGGYVMGSCASHRRVVAKIVAGSGVSALLFEYRLAPEHPFPAGLDDALAAYAWLLSQGVAPGAIAFVGDSAGGGLCLAALLAIRDRGLPKPAAAAVMSPWTNLTPGANANRRRDPVAPDGSWPTFAGHYVGAHDPASPLISPLFGELGGLPPLLMIVGEDESMLDDATGFADKARRAGVEVTLEVGRRMIHCYPAFSPLLPEAREAMARLCAFIAERTTASNARSDSSSLQRHDAVR